MHLQISHILGFMLSSEPSVTAAKNMKLHLPWSFVVRMSWALILGNVGHSTAQCVLKHSKLQQNMHIGEPWTALAMLWSNAFLNCTRWVYRAHVGAFNHHLQILTSLHGLGYKQRRKISTALKKRSRAVNTVLNEYNKQAECLGRPVLDFQQVIEYSFLSDFELLHHRHNNITQRPWANPLIHNAMISWMKTECAKEEINRLNVEARRLKTYIRDSSAAQWRAIQHLRQTDPALAAELQQHYNAQSSTNAFLLQHLHKMESLPRFSGWRTPGVRVGDILMDPRPESDEDGGAMGEVDNMDHRTVADAAVEDDIGDQLFGLDNLHPDPIPYHL
jgi:hypothetical protein